MNASLHYAPNARQGFTLVELMVVIVIVSILSALSLAGLNVARQRSKTDATRATIRKINEPIMDQYESYTARVTGTTSNDLQKIRAILIEEMPDSWLNVWSGTANLSNCITACGRGYLKYRLSITPSPRFRGAECLYMIVTRSGYTPGVLENFRPAEVGDVDKDGAKEFLDAWGNPIEFVRWAPGFSTDTVPIDTMLGWTPAAIRNYSAIQLAAPSRSHDSLDTGNTDSSAFQLYPLIYSAGPDQAGNLTDEGGYGLLTTGSATGWPKLSKSMLGSGTALFTGVCLTQAEAGGAIVGAPDGTNAYRDNVTNHDFLGR